MSHVGTHPLRKQLLLGCPDGHDRLWQVTTPDGHVFAVTDYNWEVTGRSPELSELFGYSGNWYYWSDELARRGYVVEHVEDRR